MGRLVLSTLFPLAGIMKSTLLLIRHASTDYNDPSQHRVRGRLDIAASEQGLAQFVTNARRFTTAYPIAKVYHSPMLRARETASILCNQATIPKGMQQLDGLYPWDNGQLQGRLVDEVRPQLEWYELHPHEQVPDGESFSAFVTRLLTCMRRLFRATGYYGCIAVVTHSRNIDVINAWVDAGMKGFRLNTKTLKRTDHSAPGFGMAFTWSGLRWNRNDAPIAGTPETPHHGVS